MNRLVRTLGGVNRDWDLNGVPPSRVIAVHSISAQEKCQKGSRVIP